MHTSDSDPLRSRLKHLVASQFKLARPEPDLIDDDEPLIDGPLGLDSLDALELAIAVEEEFGLTIHSREDAQSAFANIRSLAAYVRDRGQTDRVERHSPAIAAMVAPAWVDQSAA